MQINSHGMHFEHDGWNVHILLAWDSFERRYMGRAELFLEGAFRCRIALRDGFATEEEMIASLRDRAIGFITDWRRREHNADSEFAEL
ncbi:hypothetical protein QTH90_05890 [Variovorax sp. J2P1-59]|uniref:hypothetical protein n=1 Tax=Variovorax flavidus TaxID=3053501 RepID=UPI0025765DFC|nr:hypothetical protein [Variovorax sp. J2P1-59]MDM0073903.1 hypothetical protein [Variovorax sp. J2P1-59]